MRVLFAYSSEPHYMAPPRLSEDQVNCGPYFQDRRVHDRWTSLATLRGDYDLAKVARRLPASQQPDLVVVHVDGASMAGIPRNLSAFKCPKILLVADTHHGGRNPLTGMIRYALGEPFDRVVLLYDRHHAEFFRAAGIQNLHWLPSLTFAHSDARVTAALTARREPRIAIVGTTGYHPRRLRLFSGLVEHHLPLDWREIQQCQAIDHYAGSLIGLNASMNGDLNMRTFEILAGGALLLTDRLAPASGLDDLLKENREFVAYDSIDELVERARHLLSAPAEAQAIASAGAAWFREHFNEHRRREAFLDIAFHGRDRPEFALPSSRIQFPVTPSLGRLADAYHWLQVRHQKTETVRVQLDESAPAVFPELFATLPRVSSQNLATASNEPADLAVLSVRSPIPAGKPRHIWLWDAPESGASHPAAVRLAAQGWHPLPAQPFLFTSEPEKARDPADVLVEKAREHLKQGDVSGALENASSALKLSPASADALFVIVELAIETQNWPLAAGTLLRAQKIAPRHPQIALLRRQIEIKTPPRQSRRLLSVARLAYDWRDYARTRLYANLALEADADCADAHHLLGLLDFYHAGGAASTASRMEAVSALRNACRLEPRRADYQAELAFACEELRWLPEAAEAFRCAVTLEPSALLWRSLGRCLRASGSTDDARAALQQAIALAPDDEALANELRELVHVPTPPASALASGVQTASLLPTSDDEDVLPPALAGIAEILGDTSTAEVETSLRLCASFESIARQSAGDLRLPALRSLMAYQPWFGIDTPSVLRECIERGRLLVLFGEKTQPDWIASEGIHPDNFRALSHREINLWLVARHRLAITLRKSPEHIDPVLADDQSALAGYYAHAVALIDKAHAYFECYRPDTVVIAQGHDIVSAVLRHFAVLRGLRVVSLENTF
ncbi:MAG: glycosyltransferase, partial [Rariglobus sp.]